MHVVHVELLGPVVVSDDDGGSPAIGGVRLRALLARLALDAGRVVHPDALAEALWEQEQPADPRHALQSLVTRLRRGLGGAKHVVSDAGGYRLALGPDAVDARRFERLAAEGASALAAGDLPRARPALAEALALWRGPALADLVDGYRFAALAAGRLEDLRIAASLDRIEADLRAGDGGGSGSSVAATLDQLAAGDPLDERIARLRLAVLQSDGRQAEALAVYERLRSSLADALGTSPSGALRAAHLAVLRDEPVIAADTNDANGTNGHRPAPDGDPTRPLPIPLTSFVGRDVEVTRLDALLDRERLVTLVGPGGAGKTRLADETATRRDDPVIRRVELAPMTEAHEILPALLDVFGLRDAALLRAHTGPRPPDALGRLIDGLAGVRALLLLDNCEHLVADAAELAETLLGSCPDLRILATSREPLAIGGEHVVALEPLGLPATEDPAPEAALREPAVRLFADRAGAASAGFVVDEGTVGDVVEICRRLDGMPLALELAAARLRTMPLAELASRLDDRFRLLTSGPRTAAARQRTLRAVVDWSWDLLSEPERRLARRLAVLPGGATPAAAEAVCDGDGVAREDVLDLLAALVDKSVVQVRPDRGEDGQGARYRMLETLREYGLEQLERAGESDAFRDAHARWFAALAETGDAAMRGADQVTWLRRLRAERENLLAAIRWFADQGDVRSATRMTVSLMLFWTASGNPGELVEVTRTVMELPGDRDPVDRLLAEGVRAFSTMVGADDVPPPSPEGEADALARIAAEDAPDRPLWTAIRPMFAYALGDLDLAHRLRVKASQHDDPWVRAASQLFAAQLAENDGDVAGTRAGCEAALAGFRSIGEQWGASLALASLAVPLLYADDLAGAEAAILDAREMAAKLGGEVDGTSVLALVEVRLRQGRLDEAREIALTAAHGEGQERVFGRLTMTRVARQAGDREEAWRWANDVIASLEARTRLGLGHEKAMAMASAAGLELDDGRTPEALAYLVDAHAAARNTRDLPVVAMVTVVIAEARLQVGDADGGAELLGAAASLRGADDSGSPDIARVADPLRRALGDDAYAAAYARGLALDREAAFTRIDPADLQARLA